MQRFLLMRLVHFRVLSTDIKPCLSEGSREHVIFLMSLFFVAGWTNGDSPKVFLKSRMGLVELV